MSTMWGLRPAASASPCRSWTFSRREAAIRTSISRGPESGGADDAEVETHLVQGERDVLVGLDLDLDLQVALGKAGRQDDLAGDDRRGRQRHGSEPGTGAAGLDHPAQGQGHLVEVLDIAVDDQVAVEGLEIAALQDPLAVARPAEFDQPDA